MTYAPVSSVQAETTYHLDRPFSIDHIHVWTSDIESLRPKNRIYKPYISATPKKNTAKRLGDVMDCSVFVIILLSSYGLLLA